MYKLFVVIWVTIYIPNLLLWYASFYATKLVCVIGSSIQSTLFIQLFHCFLNTLLFILLFYFHFVLFNVRQVWFVVGRVSLMLLLLLMVLCWLHPLEVVHHWFGFIDHSWDSFILWTTLGTTARSSCLLSWRPWLVSYSWVNWRPWLLLVVAQRERRRLTFSWLLANASLPGYSESALDMWSGNSLSLSGIEIL